MTETEDLPIRRRVIAVAAMSIGSLMLMIDASISSVVLPTIASELGVEGASTMLVVTVYQLTLAMTLLPLAAIGDRLGYRRLYQAGFVLHTVAAFLCLFVNSLPALILVRGLQSLGAATALAVAVAMLRTIYPPHRLGAGLALNTIFNASGTALAPVVGGLVISFANWQWAFAAVAPLTLISLALSRALPTPEPRKHRFDLKGALLCALTFCLLIGGLEGAIHTRYLGLSLGALVLGCAAAWVLVRHEKNEPTPVLPIDLLATRALGLATLATFVGTTASMVVILYLPFRLQYGYGFSAAEIGGMMTAYAIASVMFSPLAGVLSDRVHVPLLCTAGSAVGALGMLSVAWLPEQPGYFDIAWRLWLCGVGFGFFFSPNARYLVGSAPRQRVAAAGSVFTTARMLAMAISATLVASLLAMGLGNGPAPALVGAALALLTAALSAIGIRHRP